MKLRPNNLKCGGKKKMQLAGAYQPQPIQGNLQGFVPQFGAYRPQPIEGSLLGFAEQPENTALSASVKQGTDAMNPPKQTPSISFNEMLQYGQLLSGIFDAPQDVHAAPMMNSIPVDYFQPKTSNLYMQKGGKATRADSLRVYNNAVRVSDFYKSIGHNAQVDDYNLPGSVYYRQAKDANQYIIKGKRQGIEEWDSFKKRYLRAGYSAKEVATAWDNMRRYSPYQDENVIEVQDLVPDPSHWLAPSLFLDKRIKPQGAVAYSYSGRGVKGDIFGNITEVPFYDPIAVKPVDMLTPAEMKLRIQRYGNSTQPTPQPTPRAGVNYRPKKQILVRDIAPVMANPSPIDSTLKGITPQIAAPSTPLRTGLPEQPATNYTAEYGPIGERKVKYFNTPEEWQSFTDANSYISRQMSADKSSAQATMKRQLGGINPFSAFAKYGGKLKNYMK